MSTITQFITLNKFAWKPRQVGRTFAYKCIIYIEGRQKAMSLLLYDTVTLNHDLQTHFFLAATSAALAEFLRDNPQYETPELRECVILINKDVHLFQGLFVDLSPRLNIESKPNCSVHASFKAACIK